ESKQDYYDILLYDFVLGFRNAYSNFYLNQFPQPVPSSPGSAPRPGGGRLMDVKPGQSFPLP
ncbi:MAG TPA: hypothetical protein VJU16_09585, partial [Planctomycetota bacterium]|nr:hypothetical protein [Planctomycetota bacterium]